MAEALRIPSFTGAWSSGSSISSHRRLSDRQWSRVRALESPSWLRECYDQIAEISRLPNNWDSYQSLPVSEEAVSGARLLLSNLNMEDLPKPQILPVADGGLGLHWRVGDHDLEVEVDPNGVYHFLTTVIGAGSIEPESQSVKNPAEAQPIIDWLLTPA